MNQKFTKEDLMSALNFGKKVMSSYASDFVDRIKKGIDPDIRRARSIINKCNDVMKHGVTLEVTVRPAETKESKDDE